MRSQLGPSSVELKTEADLQKFISREDHGVIGNNEVLLSAQIPNSFCSKNNAI